MSVTDDRRVERVREIAARWDGAAFQALGAGELVTPTLVVDGDAVEHNIETVIDALGGADRWRPHVKTVKLPWVVEALLARGVRRFKCATTLELELLVETGAPDALLAICARGANARAVRALAGRGDTAVSVLVEGQDDLDEWEGAPVAVFADVDIGLGRTGLPLEQPGAIVDLARAAADRGLTFAGLHAYEGDASSRELLSVALDRLVEVAAALARAGVAPAEVVTSGSLTAGWAGEHAGLAAAVPQHSLSPGTVVFHDLQSELYSPWQLGLRPAVAVLTRVVSSPRPTQITCDAGHKSVSADLSDPVAVVAGHPELAALTPSEEHLPLAVAAGAPRPGRGEPLALVPRHVCPTVNLHDTAVLVRAGHAPVSHAVSARGHHAPAVPFG